MLRATTACTFSTCQLPKVVRHWGVSCIFLEMCFAPQQLAFFRHVNFQKCSQDGVLCTFWLRNVLRATAACNFSSLIWPDGSAPAALASLLSTSGAPNHWKNTVVCHFSTFSHTCIFFLLTLSLLCLIFSLLLFSSLTLPTSAFSSVHIVGSLTSKKSFD